MKDKIDKWSAFVNDPCGAELTPKHISVYFNLVYHCHSEAIDGFNLFEFMGIIRLCAIQTKKEFWGILFDLNLWGFIRFNEKTGDVLLTIPDSDEYPF